ncbi:archaellin/type IV pilin N-terminal domain-containing protein [Candidatus Altiarchaeota archaeon]
MKEIPSTDKGLMGIGTLIIFIAIILVAAVAATVLITTGGSLQQKALITGSQAQEGVSAAVEIITVTASDPTVTSHNVNKWEILSRLAPGSTAVNFNTTVITVDTRSASYSLIYNGSVLDGVLASSTADFVATYAKQGPNQENGYLNRGDVVKIKFNTGQISENQPIRINIIPRVGVITQIQLVTPGTLVDPRVLLWPTSSVV